MPTGLITLRSHRVLALAAALLLAITLVTVPQVAKRFNPNIAQAAVANSTRGFFAVKSNVTPTSLPPGGGNVTLRYEVTNKTGQTLYYADHTFNTCSPTHASGGTFTRGGDLTVQPYQTVVLTCKTRITSTTVVTYMPRWAYYTQGRWVSDTDTVTDLVQVEQPIDSLPTCDAPWFVTVGNDDPDLNSFGTVDTSNGELQGSRPLSTTPGVGTSAMAIDPLNPKYAYWTPRVNTWSGGQYFRSLMRMDLTTGQSIDLGSRYSSAFETNRLAVDASGTLWTFSNDSRLYSVENVSSLGAKALDENPSLIVDHEIPAADTSTEIKFSGLRSGDIVFDGTGTMWILAGTTSGTTYLLTIGPDQLKKNFGIKATLVGEMTSPGTVGGAGTVYNGLAFNTNGTLFASSFDPVTKASSLYEINKDNGATKLIGTSKTGGGVADLASCALPAPKLVANKKVLQTTVRTGATVTYRIEVSNVANLTAAGATFQDTLPEGVDYVQGSAKLNGEAVDDLAGKHPYYITKPINGSTTDRSGVIPAGDKAVIEFDVKVKATSGKVCNQGEVNFVGQSTAIKTDDPASPGVEEETCFNIAKPDIAVVKTINGDNAKKSPGVFVEKNQVMKVAFKVTNTGDIRLDGVKISDDIIPAEAIVDPEKRIAKDGTESDFEYFLEPGDSATYTATWRPEAPLHKNTVTAQGNPPARPGGEIPPPVTATDHAFANTPNDPSIKLTKRINGDDANEKPVAVSRNTPMDITFEAKNTGNGPLTDIKVSDDKIKPEAIKTPAEKLAADGTNVPFTGTLRPGEKAIYSAELMSPAGHNQTHINKAEVVASAPKDLNSAEPRFVQDSDIAQAKTPANASVTVRKFINGKESHEAPGVRVHSGSDMTVTLEVENTGTAWLHQFDVTDQIEGELKPQSFVEPTQKLKRDGNVADFNGELAPGEKATYSLDIPAPKAGSEHKDTATVRAQRADNVPGEATASDDAFAFAPGIPGLVLAKRINGEEANKAPGVEVKADSMMNVEFEVTNNGSTVLKGIRLIDDEIPEDLIVAPTEKLSIEGVKSRYDATLNPGEHAVFTAKVPAPEPGKTHKNTAKVGATPVIEGEEQDPIHVTDSAHAFTPGTPGISVAKKVNNFDADAAPGPLVLPREEMNFTFEVTNTGTTPLKEVKVTDDFIKTDAIHAPELKRQVDGLRVKFDGVLLPGETAVFDAVKTAPEESDKQHQNEATATGISVNADETDGDTVEAKDKAFAHTDVSGGLTIVKKINDKESKDAPGVKVDPGDDMAVTFEVRNSGDRTMTGVRVYDNVIDADEIKGPEGFSGTLKPNEKVIFKAKYPAPKNKGEQHRNAAIAVGYPEGHVDGAEPFVSKESNAFAYTEAEKPAPAIEIKKRINASADSDSEPGVEVQPNSTMDVYFTLKNTGNTPLVDVTVTDNQIAPYEIRCRSGLNVVNRMEVDEEAQCRATAPTPKNYDEPHTNVATVEATMAAVGINDDRKVKDTSTAYAHTPSKPLQPSIEIKKQINGQHADSAESAVMVPENQPMKVTFTVTNNGETALTGIKVTDDIIGDSESGAESGAKSGIEGNPICEIESLEPGASHTCEKDIDAPQPGKLHQDTATAVGSAVVNDETVEVRDGNSAFAYVHTDSRIALEKKINGDEADFDPGVEVSMDSIMAITFEATNIGNSTLTDVTVTDDKISADTITCADPATAQSNVVASLAPGEKWECQATYPAPEPGKTHVNTGKVHAVALIDAGVPSAPVEQPAQPAQPVQPGEQPAQPGQDAGTPEEEPGIAGPQPVGDPSETGAMTVARAAKVSIKPVADVLAKVDVEAEDSAWAHVKPEPEPTPNDSAPGLPPIVPIPVPVPVPPKPGPKLGSTPAPKPGQPKPGQPQPSAPSGMTPSAPSQGSPSLSSPPQGTPAQPSPSPSEQSDGERVRGFSSSTSATPWGLVGIALAVLVLAGLLVAVIRRGRNQNDSDHNSQ